MNILKNKGFCLINGCESKYHSNVPKYNNYLLCGPVPIPAPAHSPALTSTPTHTPAHTPSPVSSPTPSPTPTTAPAKLSHHIQDQSPHYCLSLQEGLYLYTLISEVATTGPWLQDMASYF